MTGKPVDSYRHPAEWSNRQAGTAGDKAEGGVCASKRGGQAREDFTRGPGVRSGTDGFSFG